MEIKRLFPIAQLCSKLCAKYANDTLIARQEYISLLTWLSVPYVHQ